MADIVKTSRSGSGSRAVTVSTLTATDAFTYAAGDELYIQNNSGGALTPNLKGAAATTTPVQGLGDVDVSGGYTLPSIADGESVMVPLDTVAKYLIGEVMVTGGDAATAYIITNN